VLPLQVHIPTGEVRQAQVFVAVLGASHYTDAEATWSQPLPDWIGAHVRALAFFGGVPEVIVRITGVAPSTGHTATSPI
jgi:transposase